MPYFWKIRVTDARLMPCRSARLRTVQRRLGSLSSINIRKRGRYKQSATTACSTTSEIGSRGGTLSTSHSPRIPWARKRLLQRRTFAGVENSWAMRLLETPSAARRTMPARVRTRSGISAESDAATASRMTRSADDRGRSGAGCHTDNSIVRSAGSSESGLAWRLSMAGGCFSAKRHQRPWCRYLHYRGDLAKMVSRRKIRGALVRRPLAAIRVYKKRQNLVHCDLLLRHGGKRRAVERDTWSRYRSLMVRLFALCVFGGPCGRAARRAQRPTSGSGS